MCEVVEMRELLYLRLLCQKRLVVVYGLGIGAAVVVRQNGHRD